MSIPDFLRLSPTVYLHTPSTTSPKGDSTNPGLIILATWANAPPKLITYYTAAYRKLFPTSSILLITTTFSHVFFTPTSSYHSYLAPILPVLDSIRGPIVGTVLSNGGAFAVTSLARLYTSTRGKPIALRALILDSAPGSPDVASAQQAILASTPPILQRPIMRHLPNVLIRTFFTSYLIFLKLKWQADPLTLIRTDLLDEKPFPQDGKRTYIYSETDKIIASGAVKEHADQAEARGSVVRREEWKGSDHVAYAKTDEERYWTVVKATLAGGGSLKAKL